MCVCMYLCGDANNLYVCINISYSLRNVLIYVCINRDKQSITHTHIYIYMNDRLSLLIHLYILIPQFFIYIYNCGVTVILFQIFFVSRIS